MSTARIFKSGNSQAVRLPKEFRFRAKQVEIFRRGKIRRRMRWSRSSGCLPVFAGYGYLHLRGGTTRADSACAI